MTNPLDYIYEPEDDSRLLLKVAIEEINNSKNKIQNICEVGVGSGFVIKGIKEKFPNKNYVGTDINSYAVKYINSLGIKVIEGNLLEPIEEKQDFILFNTPYLPLEDGEEFKNLEIKDRAIYGGKKGYEVIVEFIYQINDKLNNDGFVLMLFSSLSHKNYIENILDKNLFEFTLVVEESHFFEKLYVLKIWKSEVLKQIKAYYLKYLTSGKHSIILEGEFNGESIVVKVGDFEHLQIEGIYLEKLQNEGFVPEIYDKGKEFIVMERLFGLQIKEFLEICSKEKILIVLDKVLKICQRLDELGINKFELTNPYKHIFIDKNLNVKFIDFERSIQSLNPKNTRQILQYFRRNFNLLENKGIILNIEKIREIGKRLKNEKIEFSFKDLI